MINKSYSANFGQGSLNTLAQNETSNYIKPVIIIQGKGSELVNDKTIKGKVKRKMISQKLALSLIDIAKKKGDPEKHKAFWNTYYCQNRVYGFEGRYYGKYCKNRHCTLCNSIRKAEIINRYIPVIKEWEQPYFVTLTVKACSKIRLRKMMKAVIRAFRLINSNYRKQNQRGKGIRLMGVKSLECNFNPIKRTYNPHLHLIVANKEIADILIKEWLLKWKPTNTSHKAQKAEAIYNLETALIECVKYGSKIFTEPDVKKKSKNNTDGTLYASALYNIFEAMKGIRIFDRFGFDLPPEANKPKNSARVVNDYIEWVFVAKYFDYLNADNELTLSGYAPNADLITLLENRIDIENE